MKDIIEKSDHIKQRKGSGNSFSDSFTAMLINGYGLLNVTPVMIHCATTDLEQQGVDLRPHKDVIHKELHVAVNTYYIICFTLYITSPINVYINTIFSH